MSDIYELGMAPLAAGTAETEKVKPEYNVEMKAADLRALMNEAGLSTPVGSSKEDWVKALDEHYSKDVEEVSEEPTEEPTKEPAPEETIILKKAGTYSSGGTVYIKNVPVVVEPEVAEKLMKTGFFIKE